MEQDGHAEELTQENSDELDTSVKDEELVCYRARRLVPCTELRNGMARLHFLLDTCSPGTLHTSVLTDQCQLSRICARPNAAGLSAGPSSSLSPGPGLLPPPLRPHCARV